MKTILSKTWDLPLELEKKKDQKLLINTINAYSYNIAQQDSEFMFALINSDILIPDGIGIVYAARFLSGRKLKKIAGYDLFIHEMEWLDAEICKVFFLGSSLDVLKLIQKRAAKEYPNIKIAYFSPPYKKVFSDEDTLTMISAVNSFSPDVLFVGMTAPKQEKWASLNFDKINAMHVCSIGAVFDFYAKTIKRAPQWMINIGLEWLYRLMREPRRMWKRYIIGNILFIGYILKEKFF